MNRALYLYAFLSRFARQSTKSLMIILLFSVTFRESSEHVLQSLRLRSEKQMYKGPPLLRTITTLLYKIIYLKCGEGCGDMINHPSYMYAHNLRVIF